LALYQWPIALLFTTLFPATAILLWGKIVWSLKGAAFFWPVFWGAVTYMLIWYSWIRKSSISLKILKKIALIILAEYPFL
jgi:hypothetical protein